MADDFLRDALSGNVATESQDDFLANALEQNRPLIKNNAAHVAFEAISGVFADLPRNIALNPQEFLRSGTTGVQFKSGANIPSQIANLFRADDSTPFQEKEETNLERFLPAAENFSGEVAGFGANILGGILGGPGKAVLKSIDAGADLVVSNTAGARKVKRIQQAFFEFQKQATTKYGQVLRGARKADDFSALPKVTAKEMEAIFDPISSLTEDIVKNIPTKARTMAKFVAKPGKSGKAASDFSLDELIRRKSELRRMMSVAERKGEIVTTRSKVITQTVRNIDKAIQKKIPGIAKANKDYALFSRVKELVEKFEPRFGNMPAPYGTSAGQNFLRKVANFTEEEIKLLNKFEDATSLRGITGLGRTKIVGAAQLADRVDKFGRLIGKLAGLTATIGALKAVGADRLFFTVADVAN